jgi:pimeloyl-ACP methyl ester carboxylesterase
VPEQRVTVCAHGRLAWREAGGGAAAGESRPPIVLLHGIGSGAASWLAQLEGLASAQQRVIAWDAPGYGDSDPLPSAQPLGAAYAAVLADFLRRIEAEQPIVVGHSLGAIVAAAWAARQAKEGQAASIVLACPARGYAQASAEVRAAKFRERVNLIESLGPEGLAASRAAGLCAPAASPAAIESVRANMARVTRGGYAQAAWMLANDDLAALLEAGAPHTRVLAVIAGEHDRITPPAACEAVASAAGAPFVLLAGVAHACYAEDPAAFNAALIQALAEAAHA